MKPQPMAPVTFVRILNTHEWTHEQIAEKLDVTARQIRRYVSGEAPIPHTVKLALRTLVNAHNLELI